MRAPSHFILLVVVIIGSVSADGSAGDECSATLACQKGLGCCAWDNEATAKSDTGRCGQICTQGMIDVGPAKGSEGDSCSADLACEEGLSCCATWDAEANAKSDTGTCGQMCTQGEVGVEPENGSEGDSCSADLACEEGLTCCTAWDDEGNAKADEGACGQMCTQGEFGVEPEKPKGSIGDSCSAELTCKEGLSCCNWDNEAEAEADTGVCGEVCTQGEVGEPVEKPCVPCPTRRRRAVLFSAVVDEEECCP